MPQYAAPNGRDFCIEVSSETILYPESEDQSAKHVPALDLSFDSPKKTDHEVS